MRSPVEQRTRSLVTLVVLSALIYLVLAWWYSYLSGFQPPGVFLLLLPLGLAFVATTVRTSGPVLSLAGALSGVGGYFALGQPFSACTDSPALAATLGVPTCGGFIVTALAAAIVVAVIGVAAGMFLVRRSAIPGPERGLAALGTLVVAVLVTASVFVVTTPPRAPYPSNLGPDVLAFPMPAGSSFLVPFPTHDAAANFTYWYPSPQGFVAVAFEGLAPAYLVGGWNASLAICVYVQGFTYGGVQDTALPFYVACGASVTFRFPLSSAVWQVQFSVRDSMTDTARVTITQTIQVVY